MNEEETLETRARSYSKSETKMAIGKSGQKKTVEQSAGKLENGEEEQEQEKELPFNMSQQKPANENDWWKLFQSIGTALNRFQKELNNISKVKGTVEAISQYFTTE